MKVLVNKMPDKKEECLFYRKEIRTYNGLFMEISKNCCTLSNRRCSFKNESIFGAECRCLKVDSIRW